MPGFAVPKDHPRPTGEHQGITWLVLEEVDGAGFVVEFCFQREPDGLGMFRVRLTTRPGEDVLQALAEVYRVGFGHGFDLQGEPPRVEVPHV